MRATVPADVPVVFGVDAGPELRHATIVVAAVRPDGRVFVEAVAASIGQDAAAQTEARLAELAGRWEPRRLVCVARGPVEALVQRVGDVSGVEVQSLASADLERSVRGFYESVQSRRVVHAGDLMLADHLVAAQRGEPGVLALRRRSASVDMDGAVAAVLAHFAVEHLPATTEQDWIIY